MSTVTPTSQIYMRSYICVKQHSYSKSILLCSQYIMYEQYETFTNMSDQSKWR